MNSITLNRRGALAAAVASVALLAGASSASAQLPNLGVQLNAGSLAMDVDSESVRGQVQGVVTGRLAEVQAQLRSTSRKLRRAERRLRSIERQAGDNVSRAHRRAVSRVRSLRRTVQRLSRRAARYAIAEARSAANGSWLVVSSAGRVLEQSGGISVSRLGRGEYHVSWSMDHHNCFQLYGGGPVGATGGSFHIDPVGLGAMVVYTAAATGPRDTGFFLAAIC